MLIEVGRIIRITNPTLDLIKYCERELSITNPDYLIAERLGKNTRWMDKKLDLYSKDENVLYVPYGELGNILKFTKSDRDQIVSKIHDFKGNNLVGNINLYDYQKNAVEALKTRKYGVLEAPCGSGKTQMGLQLIKEIGGKALWLTHTQKLLTQSMQRAKKYFKGDFGTITEGKVNIGKDITFATVQTMRNIDKDLYRKEFDTVIVDECHRAAGSPTKVMQFYKVVSNCNARYKYGLSATLSRSDGLMRSVFALLGPVAYTVSEENLGNVIIKAKHEKIDVNLIYDMNEYLSEDGMIDFNSLINMLSTNEERDGIILNNVVNNKNKKQLILCHRVVQVQELGSKLEKLGFKVSKLSGQVKEKDRDYDANVILATYSLAKEGLDIPELEIVHFATPQKDKSTVIQSAGRVERNIPGKEQPVIYDYVDNNISYCVNCYRQRRRLLK